MIHPLENPHHFPNRSNFKSFDLQLFFGALAIALKNPVHNFKKFLNSLIQPYILPSLDKKHILLLIGAIDNNFPRFLLRVQSLKGIVKRLDIDFLPRFRFLEFPIQSSWDLDSVPIIRIVLFVEETGVRDFEELGHS